MTFSVVSQPQDPHQGSLQSCYDSGLDESETPSSKSSTGPRLGALPLPEDAYERTTPDGSVGEAEHMENGRGKHKKISQSLKKKRAQSDFRWQMRPQRMWRDTHTTRKDWIKWGRPDLWGNKMNINLRKLAEVQHLSSYTVSTQTFDTMGLCTSILVPFLFFFPLITVFCLQAKTCTGLVSCHVSVCTSSR